MGPCLSKREAPPGPPPGALRMLGGHGASNEPGSPLTPPTPLTPGGMGGMDGRRPSKARRFSRRASRRRSSASEGGLPWLRWDIFGARSIEDDSGTRGRAASLARFRRAARARARRGRRTAAVPRRPAKVRRKKASAREKASAFVRSPQDGRAGRRRRGEETVCGSAAAAARIVRGDVRSAPSRRTTDAREDAAAPLFGKGPRPSTGARRRRGCRVAAAGRRRSTVGTSRGAPAASEPQASRSPRSLGCTSSGPRRASSATTRTAGARP